MQPLTESFNVVDKSGQVMLYGKATRTIVHVYNTESIQRGKVIPRLSTESDF